jgi:hypothetical protein
LDAKRVSVSSGTPPLCINEARQNRCDCPDAVDLVVAASLGILTGSEQEALGLKTPPT